MGQNSAHTSCGVTLRQQFSRRTGSKTRLYVAMLVATALLLGCAQTPTPEPTLSTAPNPAGTTPPAASPISVAPPPAVVATAPPSAPTSPDAAVRSRPSLDARQVATTEALTPSGRTRYACEKDGAVTEIQLPEGSGRICSRFPAMGPCQYERNACRARGGRVIRFDGVEITRDVEREYDKQVQRFRLNAG